MGSFEPRPARVQALSRRVRRWHLQGLSCPSMASAKPCTRVRFPASPPAAEWVNYLLSGCFPFDRQRPLVTVVDREIRRAEPNLNPRCGPGRSRWRGSRSAAASTGSATATRPAGLGADVHRKADADRFAREVEVDMDRGDWIDPRKSAISLQEWSETSFRRHCRCHRHRSRHTGATSSYTCCRPSATAGCPASTPRRSSSGSAPSSPEASRRRPCIATTARCAASCRPPSRTTASSSTRSPRSDRPGCRPGRSSRGPRASPRRSASRTPAPDDLPRARLGDALERARRASSRRRSTSLAARSA